MRIISGRFKGKKLLLPKDKSTRPLKDLVKESIFNLLEHSKTLYTFENMVLVVNHDFPKNYMEQWVDQKPILF